MLRKKSKIKKGFNNIFRITQTQIGFGLALVMIYSGLIYLLSVFIDFSYFQIFNHKSPLCWFTSIKYTDTFLTVIAAFEGGLVAIAIPISLHVLTRALDRYKDPDLADFFLKEPVYKFQFYLLIIHIIITVFVIFTNMKTPFLLWMLFIWFTINVGLFIIFFTKVEQYIIHIDKIILKKLNAYFEDFVF